jgi:hypothetical protein
MTLLSRFRLWRDKRALDRIKWSLSLLLGPDFVENKSDEQLIEWLRNYEEKFCGNDGYVRTLQQMAESFDYLLDFIVEYGDPSDVQGRMKALANYLLT